MSKTGGRISLDTLRYANCWEDARVLLEGLAPGAGSRVLSICSAGDNCLSLLLTDPAIVVAVDLNPVQIHLLELKRAAIKIFDRETTLKFLGFKPHGNRYSWFEQISPVLPERTRIYWTEHIHLIKEGIVHQGKFERYFQIFSRRVLPLIHSKKTVRQIFSHKTAEQQQAFYQDHFNNRRWRFFFRIFFGKTMMGLLGRHPDFLKNVELNVGQYILDQAGRHLVQTQAQNNFILRYALTGDFDGLLPEYLHNENFDLIKARVDRIECFHGHADLAIQHYGAFDAMNLSNIFEYMDKELFTQVGRQIVDGLSPGGRLLYWNLMVDRRIASLDQRLFPLPDISSSLHQSDRGFFYKALVIEQRHAI